MTLLRNILRDLLDKRLWPVAAVLGAGIVAAVVLLVSTGGGTAATAAPGAAGEGAAAPADAPAAGALGGVVSAAQESELGDDERRVVGKAKDPFRMTPKQKSAQALAAKALAGALGGTPGSGASAAPGGDASTAPGGGDGGAIAIGPDAGSGATSGSIGTPAPPAPSEQRAAGGRTFTFYEADVRITRVGAAQGRLRRDVAALTPMPTVKRPLLLYFGAFNGGSSVGFLVNRLATTESSNCAEVPGHCSLLRLKEGSSARIEAPHDGRVLTYTLKVADIRKVVTRDRERADAARTRHSNAGLCLLTSRGEDYGMLFFDDDSGSFIAGGERAKCTAKASATDTRSGFLPDVRGVVFR